MARGEQQSHCWSRPHFGGGHVVVNTMSDVYYVHLFIHVDVVVVVVLWDADTDREKKYTAHRQFGDRRGGVISARTYFYADEAKCDTQMETFINCIRASGESPSDGTALVQDSSTASGRPVSHRRCRPMVRRW